MNGNHSVFSVLKRPQEHLKEIYKTSVEEAFAARKERNRPIQYYDLLRYLHTSHPRDVHLQEIIEKIHQQVGVSEATVT